ncbi:AAA family ATPase [Winogradskyella echinorum]|uniref:AAA family ATPase n=1 Tax=Winogradskyella echinorum TaxID=538189 RepID=A0ABR6Y0L9_9FLAO|nr:AAA family ATPase [Winogradskyella echinorum]MBC3846291.1 AAA family ATPase [Winogradskyella echinorum]MBC5750639.1 AAA family ATPase [Winogradskyella echinorum]
MINRIDKIKSFGCFEDFVWDDVSLKDFNRANIFYGYNGSGKTTLSNLFFLTSKYCLNKDSLINEYITDNTNLSIKTESNSITQRNIKDSVLNLYVFNSKFITDHIYDGTKSNLDSFGSEANLTNDKIESIDDRLKTLRIRKNQFITWNSDLNRCLDSIWKVCQDEFNDKITGKRLTQKPKNSDTSLNDFETVKEELRKLYLDFENSQTTEKISEGLENIKSKIEEFKFLDIDFEKIKINIENEINQTAKEKTEERINYLKKQILKTQNTNVDVSSWLYSGKQLLKISKNDESICPLCESNLTENIDNIINEYEAYFSKGLVELLKYIRETEQLLKSQMLNVKENIDSKKDIDALLKAYDLKPLVEKLFDKETINKAFVSLTKLLTDKKTSYNSNLKIDDSIQATFENYNESLKAIKVEIDNAIIKENKRLEELLERKITDEIKLKIKDFATIEYNLDTNCILSDSKKTNSLISNKVISLQKKVDIEINLLETDRDKEISKLDAETKYVNLYLEYLGITDFAIKKVKDKTTDNISISYKSGIKKSSLKYSLSDGEKTALAFSFFLSKIRVEQLEGGAENYENCIIVIDDPISSLDENRLFQTANLIDTFFFFNDLSESKIPKQLFLLSHNITFLKYISNILKANGLLEKNVNEYFIAPYKNAIAKVPNGLKNFTNTYLQKLDEIIKFKEKNDTLEYEHAKKFIPNYIRIVLETFLAFKLAIVKDEGGDRLPGLNYLIGKAINELHNVDDSIKIGDIDKKGVEKRLMHLKKIADTESHGSLHKLEAIDYISDSELREYCKFTLQIIGYFDEIHFKRVKGLKTV